MNLDDKLKDGCQNMTGIMSYEINNIKFHRLQNETESQYIQRQAQALRRVYCTLICLYSARSKAKEVYK